MKSVSVSYLLFICLLLLLLFNEPFIELANKHQTWLGIPSMPLYIFTVWLLAIGLLYYLSLRFFKSTKEDE